MKDWEDNTDDEVMREHAEEMRLRGMVYGRRSNRRIHWHHGVTPPPLRPQPVYIVGRWRYLVIGLILLALAFIIPMVLPQ